MVSASLIGGPNALIIWVAVSGSGVPLCSSLFWIRDNQAHCIERNLVPSRRGQRDGRQDGSLQPRGAQQDRVYVVAGSPTLVQPGFELVLWLQQGGRRQMLPQSPRSGPRMRAMAHWGAAYGSGPFYNLTWREHGEKEADTAARRASEHIEKARALSHRATDLENQLIEALARRDRRDSCSRPVASPPHSRRPSDRILPAAPRAASGTTLWPSSSRR